MRISEPTIGSLSERPPDADTRRHRALVCITGLAAAVTIALAFTPFASQAVVFAALATMGALAWLLDTRTDIVAYLALLCVQLPNAAFAFRTALSDFFMLPVILRSAWVLGRGRRRLVSSTLRWPLMALLVVMAISTAVTVARTGHLSFYVMFNKDAGVVFLVLGAFALLEYLRTMSDVEKAIDAFVVGVSIGNVLALVAALLAMAGLDNPVFLPTNSRLYGWLLNPSSYGTLVVTASMLELPRLGDGYGHGERPRFVALRWTNYVLLVAAVGLTLSRSAWVALMVGAGAILLLRLVSGRRVGRTQPLGLAAAVLTGLAPALMLSWIASVQWRSVRTVARNPSAIASMEQEILVGQCLDPARWNAELCESIQPDLLERARKRAAAASAPSPAPVSPAPTAAPPVPVSPVPTAPATTTSPPVRAPAINPDGALMNARGIEARFTINNIAWNAYAATWATKLFGVGLGRFLEISPGQLGVPVIVHNTLLWFLVEMGPLGLAVLLWLLGQTALNLRRTRGLPEWQGDLSHGIAAALLAWLAFSLFNEAFYVRQFWLLLVCADRLHVLSRSPVMSTQE